MGKLVDFFSSRGWGLVYRGFCRVWQANEAPFFGEEVVETPNSFALLIFDKNLRELVMVERRRAALVEPENEEGSTTEVFSVSCPEGTDIGSFVSEQARRKLDLFFNSEDIVFVGGDLPFSSSKYLTEKVWLCFVEVSSSQFYLERMSSPIDSSEVLEIRRFLISDLDLSKVEDWKTYFLLQWFLGNRKKQ